MKPSRTGLMESPAVLLICAPARVAVPTAVAAAARSVDFRRNCCGSSSGGRHVLPPKDRLDGLRGAAARARMLRATGKSCQRGEGTLPDAAGRLELAGADLLDANTGIVTKQAFLRPMERGRN